MRLATSRPGGNQYSTPSRRGLEIEFVLVGVNSTAVATRLDHVIAFLLRPHLLRQWQGCGVAANRGQRPIGRQSRCPLHASAGTNRHARSPISHQSRHLLSGASLTSHFTRASERTATPHPPSPIPHRSRHPLLAQAHQRPRETAAAGLGAQRSGGRAVTEPPSRTLQSKLAFGILERKPLRLHKRVSKRRHTFGGGELRLPVAARRVGLRRQSGLA